jgi:hypothetical protein
MASKLYKNANTMNSIYIDGQNDGIGANLRNLPGFGEAGEEVTYF